MYYDCNGLTKGNLYLLQWSNVAFIGILTHITARYSQKWIETISVDKKGKETIEKSLKLNKPLYPVLCFKANAQPDAEAKGIVKRQFIDSNEKQCYFTDPIVSKENIVSLGAYDWFIQKIIDVTNEKISIRNLEVNLIIAQNMMRKAGASEFSVNYVSDLLKNVAVEIIDEKQTSWQELLDSQVNQLPF